MQIDLIAAESRFDTPMSLESAMESMHAILAPAGFGAIAYDFSPVPLSHEGKLLAPTLLSLRGVPDDMHDLWCRGGYFERDPVMDLAQIVTSPFWWSHGGQQSRPMHDILSARHGPVVEYLQDTRLRSGITVPIRMGSGALATFTAIRHGEDATGVCAQSCFAIGALGRMFHDSVLPGLGPEILSTPHMRLTPRERQCLSLSAGGMTSKQIAARLDRSLPTVTLHLATATRKLGARNRFHAIALACHYRLIEPVTSHS